MAEPTKVTQYFVANAVAPHGLTTRWTYTVPAGRLAMVEVLTALVLRDGAPAPVGLAAAIINYTPAGGALTRPIAARLINATVGSSDHPPPPPPIFAQPGDVFNAQSIDGSTGGTCTLELGLIATEMDA